MAVSPINITRVSHNMSAAFVAESLQRTQRDLFVSQSRIASGRRFLTASEDPVRANRALDMTQALARREQFVANAQYGDNFLAAADSALTEIHDLVTQASVIASQNVSNLTSADERRAEAEVVAAIRQQLQTVGNRQFDGRYLFAGRETTQRPFVDAPGGIAYVGDTGDLLTRVGDAVFTTVNMPGDRVFGALGGPIASTLDLSPVLTEATRLDDLNGATGSGIERGLLTFNETGGAGVFSVNLEDADTIGDVVTAINNAAAQAGATLTASIGERGVVVTPGSSALTVTDTGAGTVAGSLGIRTSEPTSDPIVGSDLGPRVTRLTLIEDLASGAGIDLQGGLTITDGESAATVDVTAAETVQDILNAINNAGANVLARINESGTGFEVFNQVSGTTLAIGENGGTTAGDLGLRTLDTSTRLSDLNNGSGVNIVDGKDDFRMTAKNGSTVEVNLDGADTVGDVIDAVNAAATAAGVAVAADLAPTGNGILITDSTGGSGSLSVSALNLSMAAADLGLDQSVADPTVELLGGDVSARRTEGILDALLQLERALRDDDTQAISAAGNRLDALRAETTRIHGVIGARSQAMSLKRAQIEDAAATTEVFLSDVQDLDYAEAATRMQAALTQLQANLQSSSSIMSLSLMDFLR